MKRTHGQCKLTGETGKFVDAHIVPKALTKPSISGLPFIEAGSGQRPVRRFDSWYDTQLVTQSGEDLLSLIDSNGVDLLRHHRLVWSGLRDGEVLEADWSIDHDAGVNLRIIRSVNVRTLRLFLLSVLWRAAESERPEFQDVDIPENHREKLRQIILTNAPVPAGWYQTILTQVSSKGPNHNLAPMAGSLPVCDDDGNETGRLRTFRFYFDGLIVHFVRPESDDIPCMMAPTELEIDFDDLAVVLVSSDKSLQIKTLEKAIAEAEVEWPEVIDVLTFKTQEQQMPGHPDIAAGDGLVMMHELIDELRLDVNKAYEVLERDRESQFLRRSAARAVFAYVEALLEAIRSEVRSTLRLEMYDGKLTEKDEEALGFRQVVGVPGKLLALEVAAKRTFKLAAKVWQLEFKLNAGGERYRDFVTAKIGRNKLTHPRTVHDIRVTDDDMYFYTVAGQWVESETQRLFKARQDALFASMSPDAREAFARLRESDEQTSSSRE